MNYDSPIAVVDLNDIIHCFAGLIYNWVDGKNNLMIIKC